MCFIGDSCLTHRSARKVDRYVIQGWKNTDDKFYLNFSVYSYADCKRVLEMFNVEKIFEENNITGYINDDYTVRVTDLFPSESLKCREDMIEE